MILFYYLLLFQALDPKIRKSFETKFSFSNKPTCSSLINFVQEQCKIIELRQTQNFQNFLKFYIF